MDTAIFLARIATTGVKLAVQPVLSLFLKPLMLLPGQGKRAGCIPQSEFTWAALRALESENGDRVLADPLAELLAGKKNMQRARERESRLSGPSEFTGNRRPVGQTIMRTKFVDDVLLAASGGRSLAHLKFIKADWLEEGTGPVTQVVVLGSGLDSRPWRLEPLDDVSWFEVDQHEVLRKRVSMLRRAKAALKTQANGSGLFPLKVKSWVLVVGNVGNASFSERLGDRGYQEASSTLWVLDGLLERLAPENVVNLLKAIHGVSSRGSWIVITSTVKAPADHTKRDSGQWRCPLEYKQYFLNLGWNVALYLPTSQVYDVYEYPKRVARDDGRVYIVAKKHQQ